MGYSEMACPHCGQMNRERCNAWMYGSPIRECKICGKKYVDNRYREPAISGIDTRTASPSLYLKMTGVFFAAALIVGGWQFISAKAAGYYYTRMVILSVLLLMASVGCLVMYIRIKLGIEAKNNAKYIAESEERLKDPPMSRSLSHTATMSPRDSSRGRLSAGRTENEYRIQDDP